MVSYKKQLTFLIISIMACSSLLLTIYHDVKKQTIEELNNRQMVYARLAANGIEESFNHYIQILNALARDKHVIHMDSRGQTLLKSLPQISADDIRGVTRVDARGKIIYSFPYAKGTIGTNISGQEHIRNILQNKRTVISDVFMAAQGFQAMAVHVPVYRNKVFDGTIGLLISFEVLAKNYLDDIKIGNSGYAWMISKKGTELYCPVPGHVGNSVLTNYKDFPEILAMAGEMMQGKTGVTTYTFDQSGNVVKKVKKHAVYMPVKAGNTFWSIVVATSEDTVLAPMITFRNRLIVVTLILILVFATITYLITKARSANIEQQKRRRIEDNLLKSAQEIHDLYHNAPCGYHSLDAEGLIVRINDTELSWLGYAREDLIGKPYALLLAPGSRENFADALARLKKEGRLHDVEYDMMRKDGATFPVLVNASAITDPRGNFVMTRSMVLDITGQRKQEERLRESETLYRTALESTSDGITILQNGKYVYVNQKFLDTLSVTRDDIINRPLGILAGSEAQKGLKEFLDRHPQDTRRPDSHITRVLKPDGFFIYLQSSSVDIIYQGQPSILTFIRDITERKKAEQALRESEELYRTAIEKTNDGISIVQEEKYVYANQKLLKTIGREETEVVNQPLGIYMRPVDLDKVKNYFVARIQGGDAPASYEIQVVKPDGSYVMLNVKAVRITYQGKPATISFVTDVTEQKRAEEVLRQSEERYRTIIENIDDDYFETDLKGIITFFNKPFSCSGLSREELIGTDNIQYVLPEMAEKVAQTFREVYRSGKPVRLLTYEVIRMDGSISHQEMSLSLMHDAQGKPVGFRGISRDVSQRVKMEEERKKLTEQLHQAQKMEAIGTLAGGIAHDFNNLLMGIQGYTSLMMLEAEQDHPHYEQLKAVQTLVQSGAGLTRQLLGFARAGRYEVVPTNLNDLINKSANLFGRTRKEIRIFEKYAEKIWTVESDRGQIEQVLLNIFVNAWQAMPGGGSLYLETENVILDNTLAKLHDLKKGRYVKISITDTGVGMDEKTRQRIFDPFFTTKEMGRGSGLGLASAYGIIKGHGGQITVYSEKGQGTTFSIYLPASSKEVDSEAPAETELPGGRETILLVDDEEVITEVTGRLLSELGYTIISAGSGNEAVAIYALRHTVIDLVIIDMIMPGLSGSDTFDQFKAINPSVRAILSSGYSLNGKAQAIMDKGVRVFLQKPYRLQDLAKKIREALSA